MVSSLRNGQRFLPPSLYPGAGFRPELRPDPGRGSMVEGQGSCPQREGKSRWGFFSDQSLADSGDKISGEASRLEGFAK